MEIVNSVLIADMLALGSVGFVVGVAFPIGARLIGYIVDSVRHVLR